MERSMMKQVLFLILLAFALLLLMGIVVSSKVHAQVRVASWQDWDWDDDWDDDWDWDGADRRSFDVKYNRVDGVYLGYRINKEYWLDRSPDRPCLYGNAGFGFANKEFQYQVGLEKGFGRDFRTAFGVEYHHLLDSPDKWRIPEWENSLAAFLIKEDFYDFYLREGWSGYISQSFFEDIILSAQYNVDRYESEKRYGSWSLFGGKKKFRDNPLMDEGDLRSVSVKLEIDTRNSSRRTTRGWYVNVEGEHATEEMKGDFVFDRLALDIRRFQPLGFGEGIDFRVMGGSAWGYLPWQKSFHLGGIGTLRGFDYKEFPNGPMAAGGNRMLLGQVEYRIGMQDLPEEMSLGVFDNFYLIIFGDAGWVANVDPNLDITEGFKGLEWEDFKSNVGLALSSRNGNIRFQLARRTDTGDKPLVFSFRVSRPF